MSRPTNYRFRLYVADNASNSARAQANLIDICEVYLKGRYEIEVVDVLKSPMTALEQNVLMTPTLLKLEPVPVIRIVGALTNKQILLDALGLQDGEK